MQVMYSLPKKQWKIGDFGLSTEGATNIGPHTERGRGISIYREPGLADGTVNMKTMIVKGYDIWAIGVMFYELVHEEMPFKSKMLAREYIDFYHPEDDPFPLPIRLPAGLENEALLKSVSRILSNALDPRPLQRPSARELLGDFKLTLNVLLGRDVRGSKLSNFDLPVNGPTIISSVISPIAESPALAISLDSHALNDQPTDSLAGFTATASNNVRVGHTISAAMIQAHEHLWRFLQGDYTARKYGKKVIKGTRSDPVNLQWTIGSSLDLVCQAQIDSGSFGDVYKVPN